jgi:KRAB domain-containing zinc finger protein
VSLINFFVRILFEYKSILFRLHQQSGVHTGIKLLTCEVCGKSYGTETLLKKHRKTHEERVHACDKCGKVFTFISALRSHVEIIHFNIRKHVCDQCGKAFTASGDLKIHKLKHVGIKFRCYVEGCTSAVTRKDVLMYHMRHNHSLSPAEQEEYMQKLNEFCKGLKSRKIV